MRLIDADKIRQKLNPDDWGTPDERWRPESEFGELIDNSSTVDPWHYPSKGELPEKDVEVLVRTVKGNNFVATIDGNENCWCVGDFFSEILSSDAVECWQYIIPPKEEA